MRFAIGALDRAGVQPGDLLRVDLTRDLTVPTRRLTTV